MSLQDKINEFNEKDILSPIEQMYLNSLKEQFEREQKLRTLSPQPNVSRNMGLANELNNGIAQFRRSGFIGPEQFKGMLLSWKNII
jgi:hypothetical protein